MKKIMCFITVLALLGCSGEDKTIVSCKGDVVKTNINMAGETAERFDCIDIQNNTRCSAVVMKDRFFMGCNELETENTKVLCMSLQESFFDMENSIYSCTLNSGIYTTKCEYKINEDNTGEIICTKGRTLVGLQPLVD